MRWSECRNSKTPNGIAEVPLTSFAVEAFKKSDGDFG